MLTINGVGAATGGYANFLLTGTGDFGNANRGTMLVHAAQRGDNNFRVEVWAFNVKDTADPVEFYSVQISTYVFEVWVYVSDFNQVHELHMLGANGVTMNLDNIGTTAPTTPVAWPRVDMDDRYTPAEIDAKFPAVYQYATDAGRRPGTYLQAAEPVYPLPLPGELWFDSDAGNTTYRWSGKVLSDDFEGTPALTTSSVPTAWSRVQEVGPLGTTSFVSLATAVGSFRNLYSPTLFDRAAGRIVAEAWVKIPAEGTLIGGITMMTDGAGANGYQVLLDARRGASGTTSGTLQIRTNNTAQATPSLNLGATHPIIGNWYRVQGELDATTVYGRVFDAAGNLLGEISAANTTFMTGRLGIVAYNAIRHDLFEARQGSWTRVRETSTLAADLNTATTAGLYTTDEFTLNTPPYLYTGVEGLLEVEGPSPQGRIRQRLTVSGVMYVRESTALGSFTGTTWVMAASFPAVYLEGGSIDANTVTTTGVFYTPGWSGTSAALNWPRDGLYGVLEVLNGSSWIVQRYTSTDQDRWERVWNTSSWGTWKPLPSATRMGSLDFSATVPSATATMLSAGASMNAGSDGIFTRNTTAGDNGIAVGRGGVYTVTWDAQLAAIASTRIYIELVVTGATGHTKAYYRFPIPSSETEASGSVTVMLANSGTRKLGVRGYYDGSFSRTFAVRLAVAYQGPLP